MLLAFGTLLALAGMALFGTSLVRTMRANPGSRMPWLIDEPPVVPRWAIRQRAFGGGLTVGGAVLLAEALSFWASVLMIAAFAVGTCVLMIRHNSRVRAAG